MNPYGIGILELLLQYQQEATKFMYEHPEEYAKIIAQLFEERYYRENE